eukprot:SM000015S01227  [mRNA]  locus=s15:623839:631089:- [translate_table: standard]
MAHRGCGPRGERRHGGWTPPAERVVRRLVPNKAEGEAIAKITINRPERRNAFRPETVKELARAFDHARDDPHVGAIIFTGQVSQGACQARCSARKLPTRALQHCLCSLPAVLPSASRAGHLGGLLLEHLTQDSSGRAVQGDLAFCSGGDQVVRGKGGYVGEADAVPRLNVLDLQVCVMAAGGRGFTCRALLHLELVKLSAPQDSQPSAWLCWRQQVQIRRLPKPVVAMVAGYAVGGGHVLHMICDLTIAADNAIFGQTGPKVGSFDAGYGCSMMARLVGQKKAREMWFLARFYTAQEALSMGLVNTVVPLKDLENETVRWCREMVRNSPTALRLCKAALNAAEDGHAGLQELAGNATLLFYGSAEGNEGRQAFLEGQAPDFSTFPSCPVWASAIAGLEAIAGLLLPLEEGSHLLGRHHRFVALLR